MIDHLGINCSDLPAAAAFYDRVRGVLGHSRLTDFGEAMGCGTQQPSFWISAQPPEGPAAGPNREIHLALTATDAATVRAFCDAATEMGADVLRAPRMWPEYHEHYYGAFVRDLDGSNVEAVCHTATRDD